MFLLKPKTQNLKAISGQLIIEAIIAITIIVVGILAVFALLSESQSLNRVVADRYVGTYLASEGIELVKNLADKNFINQLSWNIGLGAGNYEIQYDDTVLQSNQDRFLKYNSSNGIYSYGTGDTTRFKRLIQIATLGGGNEMKVNSIVSWTTRGGGSFSVNLEDHFFNWR